MPNEAIRVSPTLSRYRRRRHERSTGFPRQYGGDLSHPFFDPGLSDDDRYVVERFRAMADHDIRRCPDAAPSGDRRRKANAVTATLKAVKESRGSNPRPRHRQPAQDGRNSFNRLLKKSLWLSRFRVIRLGAATGEVGMRGEDRSSGSLFSYVDLERRVPADHPLRALREIVDEALASLSGEFSGLYSTRGRQSIAPEKLLRALLLQAFYSIRSERQLMEQLDYNLLFRWFVGLGVDDRVWDATVFCHNRNRLIEGAVAAQFLAAVLQGRRMRCLLSGEHFTVDGTLVDAWASMKSFRAKDDADDGPPSPGRNGGRDFRGEKRSNATHASTTDPDARLYRKGDGQSSRLCFMGHVLMENRNGLIVDAELTCATGTAERDAALAMLDRRSGHRRITLGADKAYDVSGFVAALRARTVTPHIAVDGHVTKTGKRRKTALDRRTTRHAGYAASQRTRKRIEEGFGWIKTTGGLAKTRHRGLARVGWMFTLTFAACNLVRLPKLLAAAAAVP